MKKVIILMFCLIMAGCYDPMPREEYVKAVKYCKENGMEVHTILNANHSPIQVDCWSQELYKEMNK